MPDSSLINRYATENGSIPSSHERASFDPLAELEAPSSGNRIVFPHDLDKIDHWISFRVHRHEFFRSDDFPKERSIVTIYLPIPSNLGTQYDQQYANEGIGMAGVAAAQMGRDLRSGTGIISSLVDAAGRITKDDIRRSLAYYGTIAAEDGVGAIVGGLVSGIPGAIVGAAATQALSGALAGAGITRNPHMAVIYDGPSFRQHTFTYKFVPRNRGESETLQAIITKFKYHQAPGTADGEAGHFFDYPEQFDIDFHYPRFLFNVGPSVLKSFEVNYHGEGAPYYFDLRETGDRAPVSVTLSLTFQETFVVTKDRIRRQNR